MPEERVSRIPGFYRLSLGERRELVRTFAELPADSLDLLDTGGLDLGTADDLSENVIGTYALPLGVALNFRVNGRDLLVPMAVEEPSVVAAASNAARLVREGGGFLAEAAPPVMIAQVELRAVADPDAAASRLAAARTEILTAARAVTPRLVERGGGAVGLETRVLSRPGEPDGGVLVVHLLVDCRDAMGANLVNTVAEALADRLAAVAGPGCRPGLRILSNLADHRRVRASARVPLAALGGHGQANAIAAASRFAELDPYRAATHNKGLMNGVDAVLLATGQDWRAAEAGAHAFAARTGRYAPLATWRVEGDVLTGALELPLAVGIVGGALHVHAGAKRALSLLRISTAAELACAVAAAGLASNLAALRALAGEGIQRGHMALHARAVARGTGARDAEAERVAAELVAAGDISAERARAVVRHPTGKKP